MIKNVLNFYNKILYFFNNFVWIYIIMTSNLNSCQGNATKRSLYFNVSLSTSKSNKGIVTGKKFTP